MNLSEKYHNKVMSPDNLSVTSRTTSDYNFPRSYKRPAPYLLWDDNIVPIQINTRSTSSVSSSDFSLYRLLLTILITLAAVGVVVVIAVAIYLGVITNNLMDEVTNDQSFDGRLRIISGDTFTSDLANTSSLEFQLKAKKYETMFNVLLSDSNLKEGYKETEVIGFRSGSLVVFFRVHLDRRKVQLQSTQDMSDAIQQVIADDAAKKNPRIFKEIAVDVESISVWDLLYKKKKFLSNNSKKTTAQQLTSTPSTRNLQEVEMAHSTSTNTMKTTINGKESIDMTTETEDTFMDTSDISTITMTATGSVVEEEIQETTPDGPSIQTDPWTPIIPAIHPIHVNFEIPKLSSPSYNIQTETTPNSKFRTRRPLHRPEALTSGVASEIPFSLPDFLAYEASGIGDQAKSAHGHFSTAVQKARPNFNMETNVGAVLLLRNTPGNNNGSINFSSPGQGSTSPLRPIAAALPPWRWRDRETSSTRYQLRYRPSFLTSTSTDKSASFVPPLIGDGVRFSTSDEELAIVTSKTPSIGETVIQSTNFLFKSPKRLDSDPAENNPSSLVSLTTQDWIPVAVMNWKTSTESRLDSKTDQLMSQSSSIPVEDHTEQSILSNHQASLATSLERDTESSLKSLDIKDVDSEVNDCPKPGNFRCRSGGCVSRSSRCDQMRDCSDNSDEDGCTCADYLYAQFLSSKICDGVVDCFDYSDENRCPKCSPEMYVCPNSNVCIEYDKICDADVDCPGGEDEKQCVRVAANESLASDGHYYKSGYLMVRKNGKWGHLCVENFSRYGLRASSSTLGLTQLASAVCQTLTFSDYMSVERKKAPLVANTYNHRGDSFYRLALQTSNAIRNVLEFNQTVCRSRDVVWMQCKNLECGVRPMAPATARIVGGTDALAGSWPWQVAMYKSGEYMCGATLINERWLLSAAHCFYNEIDNYWTARMGMLRRGSQAPHEQIHVVSHIVMHPHYIKVGFVNDVAMLRLQTMATFSDFVRPACLPSVNEESVYEGRMCTVVGWGQLLETGHVFPDTLQEVELPIFTSQECRKKTVFLQTYQITEDMFCAGYDRGGRDACLGDSGGPLVCQETSGKWSLVGITSNGFGCARAWRPGIYTKTANYVSWIEQVMDSNLRIPIRSRCRGHRCRLGKCLAASSVCNGYVECADGSDERGCPA